MSRTDLCKFADVLAFVKILVVCSNHSLDVFVSLVPEHWFASVLCALGIIVFPLFRNVISIKSATVDDEQCPVIFQMHVSI